MPPEVGRGPSVLPNIGHRGPNRASKAILTKIQREQRRTKLPETLLGGGMPAFLVHPGGGATRRLGGRCRKNPSHGSENMATAADLSLKDRLWYHRYRFHQVDPLPWTPEGPPLAQATVAVVTSAGVHLADQPPFQKEKGGDFSYRWIPGGIDPTELVCSHPSSAWDRSGIETDGNVCLPLDRLRELAGSGEIGAAAPRHASFQGSITAPMRLLRQTAPEMAQGLADDGVDIVILTPV